MTFDGLKDKEIRLFDPCQHLMHPGNPMPTSSTKLVDLMQQHLKPGDFNPLHSIQFYLSSPKQVFHEAVGFMDGKEEPADCDPMKTLIL